MNRKGWQDSAPLWAAAHLPRKGGEDYAFMEVRRQPQTLPNKRLGQCKPISPLAGEMSGRTEGGA
ncbi:hypothetical protein ATN84_09910 [Paramesorhizobium deserti]|uniref:Lytic murein transglycosylase n=1 Tax=Paramesorhizobium deserti TaxID=1494590 RepID=A0A135HXE3_9HYPH|nr:hypothetical protein ATN84_09910 [Paramesorhizobium deserti]